MTQDTQFKSALAAAIASARIAGDVMKKNLRRPKAVDNTAPHDIKLALDVRCQRLITRQLSKSFPKIPVLGEEGIDLSWKNSALRWVVDPIDGTVNYAYGIPHACVSIALQQRVHENSVSDDAFQTVVGVVFDPFMDELWTAIRQGPARLNGRRIRVSQRTTLADSIVTIGFAKTEVTLNAMMPIFQSLVHRVRKIRIMGSAALALTYVADGRFDAYIESGIRLWDIAAGGLILECAGGEFLTQPKPGDHTYALIASNGLVGADLNH